MRRNNGPSLRAVRVQGPRDVYGQGRIVASYAIEARLAASRAVIHVDVAVVVRRGLVWADVWGAVIRGVDSLLVTLHGPGLMPSLIPLLICALKSSWVAILETAPVRFLVPSRVRIPAPVSQICILMILLVRTWVPSLVLVRISAHVSCRIRDGHERVAVPLGLPSLPCFMAEEKAYGGEHYHADKASGDDSEDDA